MAACAGSAGISPIESSGAHPTRGCKGISWNSQTSTKMTGARSPIRSSSFPAPITWRTGTCPRSSRPTSRAGKPWTSAAVRDARRVSSRGWVSRSRAWTSPGTWSIGPGRWILRGTTESSRTGESASGTGRRSTSSSRSSPSTTSPPWPGRSPCSGNSGRFSGRADASCTSSRRPGSTRTSGRPSPRRIFPKTGPRALATGSGSS